MSKIIVEKDTVILITEDDFGHANLIKKNLERSGIGNPLIHFPDGQEVLDFLFRNGRRPSPQRSHPLRSTH